MSSGARGDLVPGDLGVDAHAADRWRPVSHGERRVVVPGDLDHAVLADVDVRDRQGVRHAVDVPELAARLEHGVGVVQALVHDPDGIPPGRDPERLGERPLGRVEASRACDEAEPDDLRVQVLRHGDHPAEEKRHAVLGQPHPKISPFGEERRLGWRSRRS
jgi:hypothetical protein